MIPANDPAHARGQDVLSELRPTARDESSRVEAAAAAATAAANERSGLDHHGAHPAAGHEEPKVLVLSMNTILLAGTILIGLVVAVYSLAYRSGQANERSRLPGGGAGESALLSENPSVPPMIDDPIRPGGSGVASPEPAGGATSPASRVPEPTPIAIPAKDGVLSVDPRQVGNNYMELGVLAYRDAAEAIAFLKSEGVDAAALPLKGIDPAKAKANNAPCLLFLLEGIPSGSYKTSKRVGEMTGEVRRLGKIFQKEHKGASDFSEPLWRLKRN